MLGTDTRGQAVMDRGMKYVIRAVVLLITASIAVHTAGAVL